MASVVYHHGVQVLAAAARRSAFQSAWCTDQACGRSRPTPVRASCSWPTTSASSCRRGLPKSCWS